MLDKDWYKSKEIIVGVVIVGVAVAKQFGIEIDLTLLLGALGLNQVFARIRQGN